MTQTTLSELHKGKINNQTADVCLNTLAGYEALQRMAKLLGYSSIVPDSYRAKNEKDYTSLGNCVIALDMALRMDANPLMVMQHLFIVHGRPAWSAQFLIATLNKCGRFSALRYAFQGQEGKDDWGCRAVATELATGEKLEGPLITIALAKKEGWYGKNGSKWQTMPEMMLRYRAAAWFVRVYAPEIAMGLQTADEVRDTIDLESGEDGQFSVTTAEIKAEVVKEAPVAEPAQKPAKNKKAAKPAEPETPAPEPVKEPVQEQPKEPTGEEETLIICPNTGRGKPAWACNNCMDRDGCPAWPDED